MREQEILRQINHRNIAELLKCEENEQDGKARPYTEYCEGGDLTNYIEEYNPMGAGLTQIGTWSFLCNLP